MIVTLTTFQSGSKENRSSRIHTIEHLIDAILFWMNARFDIAGNSAMKSSCDFLVGRGVRNQITRQLFQRELIKRHVVVHRVDHPISIRPAFTQLICLITVGVGVAGQIQPGLCPTFAVSR